MTTKIKKSQLKQIINKEYLDILREVKNKEAAIDQAICNQVVKTLIKENILDEQLGTENLTSYLNPWSSASKMRRGISAAEEEEAQQPGESWEDVRGRQGYGSFGQEPAPEFPEEETSAGAAPERPELPTHFQQELVDITQNAPVEFRGNIKEVGDEVYTTLQKEIGGLKTQEQLGELVLNIVNTVVTAMGGAGGRKWASEDAFETSFLDDVMAMDPDKTYPQEARG
jgi:hypothetical protein